ncbi:MAG: hypothetical protein KJO31_11130 [Gammaproteobacteria bacterium]|nr:hypothetical protein [Gammaproteobacteria bacterium]
MDTAWVQVFVLVFSQCAAPAGKTVCQEQELRYQFLDRNECEQVLEQLLEHKDAAENVIVNRDKSRCLPTVRSQRVFASVESATKASAGLDGWGELPAVRERTDFISEAHQKRLDELFECEQTGGVAPCKVGNVIVEGSTVRKGEVWVQEK